MPCLEQGQQTCAVLGSRSRTALLVAFAILLGSAPARAASPPQPSLTLARHYQGQTYVAWAETAAVAGESYRVYRHDQAINAGNLGSAQLLWEVHEGSSAYWSDYYFDSSAGMHKPRFSATRILAPSGAGNVGIPLGTDTGMLVWTIAPDEIAGSNLAYYAVTTVTVGGLENTTDFTAGNTWGPVTELSDDPRPLKLETTVGSGGLLRHVYVQYMDLRDFNPTLTAPNAVYQTFGQSLSDPKVANDIQYAFSYVVLEPPAQPQDYPLPVVLRLHPFGFDTAAPEAFTETSTGILSADYYDYPAIEIRPIDVGSTWWFGFAEDGFDYRTYSDECDAIDGMVTAGPPPAIVNYTEARVVRMVHDLLRDDLDLAGKTDPERVYVTGWSMGGAGALAMALRYPELFAASFATVPVTDFAHLVDPSELCPNPSVQWPANPDCYLGFQLDLAYNVAAKWGPPSTGSNPFTHVYPGRCSFPNPAYHVQPVRNIGPSTLADHLAQYDGTPIYEYQDLIQQFRDVGARDIAPVVVRHSSIDRIANWPLQGQPLYEAINDSGLVWGGLVDDALDHLAYWFVGMPQNYVNLPGQGPFFGLTAVLSETVPGLRLVPRRQSEWSFPPPSFGFHEYNVDTGVPGALGSSVEWSASWYDWDGPPIDTPDHWQVSLRLATGKIEAVDVSPRRVQQFVIEPGAIYSWSTTDLHGAQIDCGCIRATRGGQLTIPNVVVRARGVRVSVRRGVDPDCSGCDPFAPLDPPVQATIWAPSPP